jgi:hypothetical protein
MCASGRTASIAVELHFSVILLTATAAIAYTRPSAATPVFSTGAPSQLSTGASSARLPEQPSGATLPSPSGDGGGGERSSPTVAGSETQSELQKKPSTISAVVVFNAGLAPFGKVGGRAEVGFLKHHALFFEPSYFHRYVGLIDKTVDALEFDAGYHLFPAGHGASGWYLGPRGSYASGTVELGRGRAWGFGFDFGYSYVMKGHAAVNLGLGVSLYHVTGELDPATIPHFIYAQLTDKQRADLTSQAHTSLWIPLPMAMAGLGFGF